MDKDGKETPIKTGRLRIRRGKQYDTIRVFSYCEDGRNELSEFIEIGSNDLNYFALYDDSSNKATFQKRYTCYEATTYYTKGIKQNESVNKYFIYSTDVKTGFSRDILEAGTLLETREEMLKNIADEMILSKQGGASIQRDIGQLHSDDGKAIKEVLDKYNIPLSRMELKHAVKLSFVYDYSNKGRITAYTKGGDSYVCYYNEQGKMIKVSDTRTHADMIFSYSDKGLLTSIRMPSAPENDIEYTYTYNK